ncbi:MAG TPA: MerR family DNA-binding protein [Gemmatimonadales bacterium]|jgi:MerR family mercuric resistance operon transcriptional regulator
MTMTIGQVASGAGVNIQTVRYYERRGLLPKAPRTPSGYRQYDPEAVARLRFIKRAQELGFSLEEVAELLELRVEHGAACQAVESKAKEKIAMVESKIGELERMKAVLVELARACDVREPTSDCPILATLSEDA